MSTGIRVAVLSVSVLIAGGDLLACGDKFLVGSRGTRYQRPKNVRTASILIYADPSSESKGTPGRVQSMLKSQGHRARTVASLEQLSALVTAGSVDVVLVASDAAAKVHDLLGDHAVAAVVAFDSSARRISLLSAIDSAVLQRDQSPRRN